MRYASSRFALLLVAFVGARTVTAQTLADPTGHHPVGYLRTTLSTPHPDLLSADPADTRALLLEVWYPATSPGPRRKPYVSAAMSETLAEQFGLVAERLRTVRTHATEGAPIATGRHPVVVFSHGLSWPIALYQTYTEDLASNGYVVVAVNHPHGASLIEYGDGRTLGMDRFPRLSDDSARQAFLARHSAVWARDIEETLTRITQWSAATGPGPLGGALDTARMALVGHSFGASAVARLAAGTPRVKAVALMEGRFRDSTAKSLRVQVPLLHLIGEYNRLELENRDYLPSANAPVYNVVVGGTGHAYFSDLIAQYKPTAPPAWHARHRYELEPERIIQISRDYLTAFLGRYLRGTDSVLLHPPGAAGRVAGPRSAGYAEVRLTIDVM